ncbi:MAG: hypothetical protein HKN07_16385 [Acidimicrobiia bacterium]|nr:DUF4190 domain-containing protein [Acidimicrobiia bacterium]NNF65824.1 hypothetical protein [Acidimicrobiia bacterium]
MTFQTYPEQSQATLALVLGILGFVLCGVLAPFAWSIGSKELAAIDNGLRDPANRGTANAGKILGMIGTIFLGIAVVAVIVVLVFAVAAGP